MTGVVNLLKPPGMTSQNAVSNVKRILGVKKAGHAGTLDPAACGVLPICLGRATKLASYLTAARKEYVAELTLGCSTDTLDSTGTVLRTTIPRPFSTQEIEKVLESFRGRTVQTVPSYSAVKVAGRPLYEYARKGMSVPVKTREIEIDALELVQGTGVGPFLFRVTCSKGTYVRSLLADIADRLGQAGYTSFLMRTRCGSFEVQNAVTFSELESESGGSLVMSAERAAPGEKLVLPAYLYRLLRNGVRIIPDKVPGLRIDMGKLYSVSCAGEFFGLGEYDGTELILRAFAWDGPRT